MVREIIRYSFVSPSDHRWQTPRHHEGRQCRIALLGTMRSTMQKTKQKEFRGDTPHRAYPPSEWVGEDLLQPLPPRHATIAS